MQLLQAVGCVALWQRTVVPLLAYATPFNTSAERQQAMHPWLHDYNTARPHSALGGKPPISRLNRDNLQSSDI